MGIKLTIQLNKVQYLQTITKIITLCLIVIIIVLFSKLNVHSTVNLDNNLSTLESQNQQRLLFSYSQMQNNNEEQFWNSVEKDVYSVENQKTVLGTSQEFTVKIDINEYQKSNRIKQLKQANIWDKIQVGSEYDDLNLTNTINFSLLRKDLFNSISYELFTYHKNWQLEKNQKLLTITNERWQNFDKEKQPSAEAINDREVRLAASLIQSPLDIKLHEQEYIYYDNKYKIGNPRNETPICLFISGYKTFETNDKYTELLFSIQMLNYTDFHIVFVDDSSTQQSFITALIQLQQKKLHLKNKLKIIHTLQHLGALTSSYFFINKHCKKNQIVVTVNADGKFIGRQALQIINAEFDHTDTWLMQSKVLKNKQSNPHSNSISNYNQFPPTNYRTSLTPPQIAEFKIFKKQLFEKIPLEAVIEFQLDQSTQMVHPKFYEFGFDVFLMFPMFDMAKKNHTSFISSYLFYSNGSHSRTIPKKCTLESQRVAQMKAIMKNPLRELSKLSQQPVESQNHIKTINHLDQLTTRQKSLSNCLPN